MASHGVHGDLPKDTPDMLNNNLFRDIMSSFSPKILFKELHILITLPFLGLPGLEAPSFFWRTSLYII